MSLQDCINQLGPYATAHSAVTGIPASLYIAIATQENGCSGGPEVGANNFFGIKAVQGQAAVPIPTWEVVNGQTVNETDLFRYFPSVDGAFQAFDSLVTHDNPQFAGDYQQYRTNGNSDQFLQGLNNHNYATDPTWASKVSSIMRSVGNSVPSSSVGGLAGLPGPIAPAAQQGGGTAGAGPAQQQCWRILFGRCVQNPLSNPLQSSQMVLTSLLGIADIATRPNTWSRIATGVLGILLIVGGAAFFIFRG